MFLSYRSCVEILRKNKRRFNVDILFVMLSSIYIIPVLQKCSKYLKKSFIPLALKELSKPRISYFYKVVHPWILRIDPYISNQASALKVLKCCGICYPAPFLHTNWIQYSYILLACKNKCK